MSQDVQVTSLSEVKKIAKSLRRNMPAGIEMKHHRALEVVAEAFGFSSYQACRSYLVGHAETAPASTDLLSTQPLSVRQQAGIEAIVKEAQLSDRWFRKRVPVRFKEGYREAQLLSALRSEPLVRTLIAIGSASSPPRLTGPRFTCSDPREFFGAPPGDKPWRKFSNENATLFVDLRKRDVSPLLREGIRQIEGLYPKQDIIDLDGLYSMVEAMGVPGPGVYMGHATVFSHRWIMRVTEAAQVRINTLEYSVRETLQRNA